MTGDAIPVGVVDVYTNRATEIKHPREITEHGYHCPVCAAVIDACHDAALLTEACTLWEGDPCSTLPAGFALVE